MQDLYSVQDIKDGIKRRMKTKIPDHDMEKAIDEMITGIAFSIHANNILIKKLIIAKNKN